MKNKMQFFIVLLSLKILNASQENNSSKINMQRSETQISSFSTGVRSKKIMEFNKVVSEDLVGSLQSMDVIRDEGTNTDDYGLFNIENDDNHSNDTGYEAELSDLFESLATTPASSPRLSSLDSRKFLLSNIDFMQEGRTSRLTHSSNLKQMGHNPCDRIKKEHQPDQALNAAMQDIDFASNVEKKRKRREN